MAEGGIRTPQERKKGWATLTFLARGPPAGAMSPRLCRRGSGGTGPGGAVVPEPAPGWEDLSRPLRPPPLLPPSALGRHRCSVLIRPCSPPLHHAPPGRAAAAGSCAAGLPGAPKLHRPPGRVSARHLQVGKRGIPGTGWGPPGIPYNYQGKLSVSLAPTPVRSAVGSCEDVCKSLSPVRKQLDAVVCDSLAPDGGCYHHCFVFND